MALPFQKVTDGKTEIERERILLQELVEKTVNGCGYDLVDIERAPGGILRVYIDCPLEEAEHRHITLDDCEKVSRQLSHVLVVEDVDYDRLEVSSPGLDRPLKRMQDFVRFVGWKVYVKLRKPVTGMGNRKVYQGVLLPPKGDDLALEFAQEDNERSSVLYFTIADIEKARLVPQVNFRSRKA